MLARTTIAAVVAASLAALLGGCTTARRMIFQPLGLTSAPGYEYDVKIVGVGGQLEQRLEEASILFSRDKEPPATLQGLRRRAQSDRDLLLRVMRSRGWYDGEITWHIDSTKKPALVEIKVERGPRYKITRFEITGLPEEGAILATEEGLLSLGVSTGAPALAETVLKAEAGIVAALAIRGYPYAELPSRDARIDRRAKTMEVAIVVDAGPRTRFGEVTVEGLHEVDKEFVMRRLKFEPGETFAPGRIDESRKTLFATGVFSSVTLKLGTRKDVGPDGLAPVTVVVTEGKMHSIGLGVKYSSADGPGGRAFWENRNVSGGADRLRGEVELAEQVATGGISYRRPDWFGVVDQSLLIDAFLDADDVPAYDRYAFGISAGAERRFSKRLAGTAGLSLEQSDVNSKAEAGGSDQFTLIGVPLGLRYDGSDSLLDPAKGHRTLISATPYVSVLGNSVQMLVARATESFYVPLRKDQRVVWATRFTLGSVVGAERNEIPADKRMYAGGGDSVRGYKYQFVGPIVNAPLERDDSCPDHPTHVDAGPPKRCSNPNFRPLGGRSLLQFGTEVRWKIGENLGVVPFLEGGGVYGPSYPDFGEDFLWAAGIGLRYFTVAGPIRFDVGFPLNPRSRKIPNSEGELNTVYPDDIFEVYISLGQAF